MKHKMLCVHCDEDTYVITEGIDTTVLCPSCKEAHETWKKLQNAKNQGSNNFR